MSHRPAWGPVGSLAVPASAPVVLSDALTLPPVVEAPNLPAAVVVGWTLARPPLSARTPMAGTPRTAVRYARPTHQESYGWPTSLDEPATPK